MIKQEILGKYGNLYEETPKNCTASYVDYNINMSEDVTPKGEVNEADGAQKRKRIDDKGDTTMNSPLDTTAASGESPEKRARRKEEKKKKKKAKKEAEAAVAAVTNDTTVKSWETIVYGDESGKKKRKKFKIYI